MKILLILLFHFLSVALVFLLLYNSVASRKIKGVLGLYTVLLVDDDNDILTNIQSSIDWPVYGVEHVLCALDGEQALSIIKQRHIDILITDISMPCLDGLQLIRQAQMHQSTIRCILLSSYSDFAYAKEAISLGVESYLVKPINKEELDNSIRKAIDNIFMGQSSLQTLLLDNILYRWVTNEITHDDFVIYARHIGINPYFRNYCVTLLKSSQKKPLNHIVKPFLLAMSKRCDCYRFTNYDGLQVLIFGGHALSQLCIHDTLKCTLGDDAAAVGLAVSVGIVVESAENLSKSYQSALESLLMYPRTATDFVVCAREHRTMDIDVFQLNLIVEHLKSDSNNDSNTPEWCCDIFAPIDDCSLDELNAFTYLLVARVALHLNAVGLIDASAKEQILVNTYHFEDTPSQEELYSWFARFLSFCRVFIRTHAKNLSPITLSAIEYVNANHAGYVSIKDFCTKYSMNASYLGLLFKKETGIYFNDYINQIRVSHAMNLLKTTKLKVLEICKSVGFGNTSYFILSFKKQTGVSPAKFRQIYSERHQKHSPPQ